MKAKIIGIIIVLCSLSAFGQKLTLEKASPFMAVKWENNQPIVQFENVWYSFEKLDNFTRDKILNFCKKEFGHKWKKRFSEDLVEVLQGLNYTPNQKVQLTLSKKGISKEYTGVFTAENRKKCLLYNRAQKNSKPVKKALKEVSKMQAIDDLKQFSDILNNKSSYAQLSNYDYNTAIKKLAATILSSNKETINIDKLTHEIGKIMAEIGDRHSSIKNEAFNKKAHNTYNLRLPFGITILNGKAIAVQQKPNNKKEYSYYNNEYPYIKSIDGIAIETLMNDYNYRNKKAPKEAKLTRGANAIQKLGALLFKNNKNCSKTVEVEFSNNKKTKKETVELTLDKKGYISNLSVHSFISMMNIQAGRFNDTKKLLTNNIGYIKIPRMFNYKRVEGYEDFLENTMKEFSKTKALIIDVRDNPGGRRVILQTFAKYIVQPAQSPWIANIAYLRTNEKLTTDESSMSTRYLNSYNSNEFSESDRVAINNFNKTYKTTQQFDKSKFSNPFYMVLRSGKTPYQKPVYILVNENSFSAATVFTTAFKGLPNVKIVGVTTDGSSGNSRKVYLNNSKIRVKVSTMLSFQRNGKTLDGNGTEPNIYIPVDATQIFTGKDTQLERLVTLINK
ncbi:S41 family peptidase [uncultured Tenacibaculum sp.]|uniref:S41 family peptidase n=1 Tax=uncultured Tenacibaculum sp. TaxID=174713 RepID=UPI0026268CCF|nr:S41 family peptidase [uncultured Tenacibaculum sp.]